MSSYKDEWTRRIEWLSVVPGSEEYEREWAEEDPEGLRDFEVKPIPGYKTLNGPDHDENGRPS